MPEIITCPSCQRRLYRRDGDTSPLVQCPSCKSQFEPELPLLDAIPLTAIQAEPTAPAALPALPAPPAWPTAPRAARPPVRGRSVLGAVAVAVCLVVLTVFLLAWVAWDRPSGRFGPFPIDDEDRQEVANAFRNRPPIGDDTAGELKPVFDTLGAAFKAGDRDQLMKNFDVERLLDELVAQDMFPREQLRARRSTLRSLREHMGRGLAQQAPLIQWTTTDIKGLKRLGDDDVVVIARHRDAEGSSLKMRWWLTRRSGSWKVYDLEDLDMGLRFTTTVGSIAQGGIADVRGLTKGMNHLRAAMIALVAQNDPDAADKELRQTAGLKFPKQLEALRCVVTASVRLARGEFQEALTACEEARGFQPDMPCLDLFQGMAHNRLGSWEKALAHLEAYRAALGDDADLCRELGTALHGLARYPEACAAFRLALDDHPQDGDAFLGLLQSLRPTRGARDELGERFARLDDHRDHFDTCAEDCREARDGVSLEPIALAMRRIDPAYAEADYHLALARVWTGQSDQAVAPFQAALAKQKDAGKRHSYVLGFMQAMAGVGKATQAYAAAPDPREGFRLLVGELLQSSRHEDLQPLTALHAVKDPRDPLLPFCRAEVQVHGGQYRQADQSFTAGMAKPPDDAMLQLFRASRVQARYRTAGALAAYDAIGPRTDTFQQLAYLCWDDRDDRQLQALLDAHARHEPDSDLVRRYRYRLKLRLNDVAEGVRLFKDMLAKQDDDDARRQAVSEFLFDMLEARQAVAGYQAAPDAPGAFQTLADELMEEGRWVELGQLIEAHRKRCPDERPPHYYTGQLHLGTRAWDKAVAAFRAGQKFDGDADRCKWACRLALYRAGRGLDAYREAADADSDDAFEHLADLMAGDRKWDELDALIAAHRPHAPANDPELLQRECRVRVFQKKPAEAFRLLLEARKNQPLAQLRNACVATYVNDMHAAGSSLEGYRTAPDKAVAFQALGRLLSADRNAQALQQLLDEHARENDADAWLAFYKGELHLLRGETKAADRQFTSALALATSPDEFSFRMGYLRGRIAAGRVVETYKREAKGDRPFEELARLCIEARNADQLEALLAAHRAAQPNDLDLPLWDLELRWLRGDYSGALQLLTEHRDGLFGVPRHRWKTEDYQVRVRVRLKKFNEAITAAEALDRKGRNRPVLLVLAHAAAGDLPKASAALETHGGRPYVLLICYNDPDLGPLLRSEPFQALRAKFPEPAANTDVDP